MKLEKRTVKKINFKKISLISSVLLLLFALLLAGCSAKQETKQTQNQKIKVGVMLPLSGDAASYGVSVQKGIELAKKDLKNDNVELVYEDSKCNAKDAVAAMTKLATVDGVKAVIGEVCSSATLPAAPIANQYEVVLISPSATSPKLTDAGDYIFRVVPSDALQGDFAANLISKKGFKKLAVLHTNEDYGLGFATVLQDSFKKLGGEVASVQKMNSGETDLRTQLLKIKESNPDAISIASNSPDSSAAALKQIKELGIKAQIFGSEALYGQTIIDAAKDAAEGLTVTSVTSGTTDFAAKFKAEYKTDVTPFSAQGYDCMTAVGLAIQQGALSGKEIKDKLYATEFTGATGKVKFESSGDVPGNYDIYTVVNGKWVLQ